MHNKSSIRRFGRVPLPALALALLCSSCLLFQRTVPPAGDLLPIETDVPGWSIQSRRYLVRPQIEKERPAYAGYAVRELAAADYRSISGPSVINVEIVKCVSALHAYSLFSIERASEKKLFSTDVESYYSPRGAFFLRGEYYVRLVVDNRDGKNRKALSEFRECIENNLKPHFSKEPLPVYATVFYGSSPADCMAYYINGHELIPGSSDIFVKQFKIQGRAKEIFFIKAASSREAEKRYAAILRTKGQSYVLTQVADFPVSYKSVRPYYVFVTVYGNWIFGVLNAESIDDGSQIILKIYEQMKQGR